MKAMNADIMQMRKQQGWAMMEMKHSWLYHCKCVALSLQVCGL